MQNQNQPTNNNKKGFQINKGLYFINIENFKNKKSEDLWKKPIKTQFFIWLSVFFVTIVGLNILAILEVVFWNVDKNAIISNTSGDTPEVFWRLGLGNLIISMVFQLIMLASLSYSIYKCWINKSFKHISVLPTLFIFLNSIMAFWSIISYAIKGINVTQNFNISWVLVSQFVMMIVYPFIWFFISRNISLIRNIAFQIEMQEKFAQQAQMFMGQNGGANPFAPNAEAAANANNTQNEINKNQFNTNDAFYIRLKNLSRDQLNEMAKALSISGYDVMSDEELMKIIWDIRNVQNQHTSEKEIEVVSEDKVKDKTNENNENNNEIN